MKDGLRNMTSVYLLRGENVLLLYRIGSRVVRACYTGSAGGHFEEGELNDPRACVLRELREETGLTEECLTDLRLRYVTLRLKKGEIRQNYYFFANLADGVEPTGSNEGVLRWFHLSELDGMDMPWTARAVMDHYLSVGRGNDLLYGGMATEAGVTFVALEEFEGRRRKPMFYFDWTYLLILPGLLFGLWAQSYVNRAYHQASGIRTRLSRPASEVVDEMLRRNGNRVVTVRCVAGELTDHYDPRSETLNLSEGVHDSASVAALGIAAHEAGHAMQKQEGYAPLKLRSGLVPAVNICSTLSTPLFVLGLLLSWPPLLYVGIALFAASTVFALVTLPVEFNASSRAMRMLTSGGYLTEQEAGQAQKVLNAAALTYVAAAVTSLLSLLRLLVIARRRDS